jgi:uncharacterized RDD family membrane protein YckC
MSSVAPGWYKDPADPTVQRYWDGDGWVGASLPADATPPPGPPPGIEQPGAAARQEYAQPTSPTDAVPTHPWSPPAPSWPGAHPAPAQPSEHDHPAGTAIHPATPPGTPADPATPPGASSGWPGPPYRYPPPAPQPRPHGLRLAPLGSRLTARLIDIGVVALLNVAVNGWFVWEYLREIAPLLSAFGDAWRRAAAGDRTTEPLPQPNERADWLVIVILVIATALWFAYEVPALANTGQTLGKRLMGIKVVPVTADERLGFARSLRRWNRLGVPTLLWGCCGIGFLLQLIDCGYVLFDQPLHQALHDKSARTVVVKVSAETPPPRPPDRVESPGGPA